MTSTVSANVHLAASVNLKRRRAADGGVGGWTGHVEWPAECGVVWSEVKWRVQVVAWSQQGSDYFITTVRCPTAAAAADVEQIERRQVHSLRLLGGS